MTWKEANLSLQLASEERVGFIIRERARLARAEQDAAFGALAARQEGRP